MLTVLRPTTVLAQTPVRLPVPPPRSMHPPVQILSPLRCALSPDRQLRFSQDWHVAVACAPTRPHPHGPTASPWAALMHPLAGLADRAADWWAADRS